MNPTPSPDNTPPIPTTDAVLDALVLQMAQQRNWPDVAAATQELVATGAVVRGLSHPVPRVRRWCADFFDHARVDSDARREKVVA